jgi:hypothetical protein
MSDNKFEWTDERVLEFVRYTTSKSPIFQGRYKDLEDFKASKEVKKEKDYEIESVLWIFNSLDIQSLDIQDKVIKKVNGKFRLKFLEEVVLSDEEILKNKCIEIFSVKRLSDGEVFSIGDKIICKEPACEISEFTLRNNEVIIICKDREFSFRYAKKEVRKPPQEEIYPVKLTVKDWIKLQTFLNGI